MSDRIHVATRKGLFTVDRRTGGGGWAVTDAAFLGDNVTLVMRDARDETMYAALDHGHFGVKLHRSCDAGRTWTESATPAYPERPKGAAPDVDPVRNAPIEWTTK
ncbi:MAG: exo-alpha-sialidase, partial [Phycisphaerae bacterium]